MSTISPQGRLYVVFIKKYTLRFFNCKPSLKNILLKINCVHPTFLFTQYAVSILPCFALHSALLHLVSFTMHLVSFAVHLCISILCIEDAKQVHCAKKMHRTKCIYISINFFALASLYLCTYGALCTVHYASAPMTPSFALASLFCTMLYIFDVQFAWCELLCTVGCASKMQSREPQVQRRCTRCKAHTMQSSHHASAQQVHSKCTASALWTRCKGH